MNAVKQLTLWIALLIPSCFGPLGPGNGQGDAVETGGQSNVAGTTGHSNAGASSVGGTASNAGGSQQAGSSSTAVGGATSNVGGTSSAGGTGTSSFCSNPLACIPGFIRACPSGRETQTCNTGCTYDACVSMSGIGGASSTGGAAATGGVSPTGGAASVATGGSAMAATGGSAVVAATGGTSGTVCIANAPYVCSSASCVNGQGTMMCNANGTGYLACTCVSAGTGGATSTATGGAAATGGTGQMIPSGCTTIHLVYVAPATYSVVEIFGKITNLNRTSVYMRPTPLDASGSLISKAFVWGVLQDGVHPVCEARGTNTVVCDMMVPSGALMTIDPHYYNVGGDMFFATYTGSLAGSLAITSGTMTIPWRIAGPYSAADGSPAVVVEFVSP